MLPGAQIAPNRRHTHTLMCTCTICRAHACPLAVVVSRREWWRTSLAPCKHRTAERECARALTDLANKIVQTHAHKNEHTHKANDTDATTQQLRSICNSTLAHTRRSNRTDDPDRIPRECLCVYGCVYVCVCERLKNGRGREHAQNESVLTHKIRFITRSQEAKRAVMSARGDGGGGGGSGGGSDGEAQVSE